MTLWLVRHARPLVEPGVCYGMSDVPADESATLACAQVLAGVLPQGLHLMTSPLQRCEQLAHSLQGLRPDLMLVQEVRLAEMDFGCWEGQRWDAIPRTDFDRWTRDFGRWRVGGGESVNAFMQRVAAVWDEAPQSPHGQVWITHAGVIRATTLLARGIREVTSADQWPRDALGFGEHRHVEK